MSRKKRNNAPVFPKLADAEQVFLARLFSYMGDKLGDERLVDVLEVMVGRSRTSELAKLKAYLDSIKAESHISCLLNDPSSPIQ